MARRSKRDYSSERAELLRKLQALREAAAQVRSRSRDLDLKIKNLKKGIDALNHPFMGIPDPSRK
jgi:hypothetical protein